MIKKTFKNSLKFKIPKIKDFDDNFVYLKFINKNLIFNFNKTEFDDFLINKNINNNLSADYPLDHHHSTDYYTSEYYNNTTNNNNNNSYSTSHLTSHPTSYLTNQSNSYSNNQSTNQSNNQSDLEYIIKSIDNLNLISDKITTEITTILNKLTKPHKISTKTFNILKIRKTKMNKHKWKKLRKKYRNSTRYNKSKRRKNRDILRKEYKELGIEF